MFEVYEADGGQQGLLRAKLVLVRWRGLSPLKRSGAPRLTDIPAHLSWTRQECVDALARRAVVRAARDSGVRALGGLPTDPGGPITHTDVVEGRIPAKGGYMAPGVQMR
ncbi:hypothetical protein GCM10010243_65310 [Streptomyces matensis]|nr:hypothetical protein GCM10010243_65310 [Streptomyces matensis]